MARKYTKCSLCDDILWFGDEDAAPQAVVCPCNATTLKETGAEGNYTDLTEEEIAELPE